MCVSWLYFSIVTVGGTFISDFPVHFNDATMRCFFGCLQPAQWQLSPDGKRLIGHMTLRKPISDNDSVGEARPGEPGGAVGRGALGKFCVLSAVVWLSCVTIR